MWDMRNDVTKLYSTKTCLHPLAGAATCSGPIVLAHTVRRAADLAVIARKGHVLQASADLADLQRNAGRITPKPVGINEASTFRGFCNKHDTVTFGPLESTSLIPTVEQAFLLAYRPLCKELYFKERQLESLDIAGRADKGRSVTDQAYIQERIFLSSLGPEQRSVISGTTKSLYDRDLLSHDFSEVRYVAIQLDCAPDLMCSGIVQPHYTFDGRQIQDLAELEVVLEAMSFTLAATSTGGVAIFAWRSDSDRTSSLLVDSLLRIPDSTIPEALVRYATSEFENTYLRPDWWEGLEEQDRHALSDRFHHGVDPENQPTPHYLADDGRRTVRWNVTSINQQRS